MRIPALFCLAALLLSPNVFAHDEEYPTAPAANTPAPDRVGVGREVLINGGFEDGATGWTFEQGQALSTAPRAAHSGKAGAAGTVTADSQAARAIQRIDARQGRVYRYAFYARGTQGTKVTVFIGRAGGRDAGRTNVGTFKTITAGWKKYEGSFSVDFDGTLDFEIIAPTSFGAAPGTVWIDDASIVETEAVRSQMLSGGQGFNDQPVMVRANDGLYVASWVSFRDGQDTIQMARFKRNGDEFDHLGQWDGPAGATFPSTPALGVSRDVFFLVYAAEKNGDWDIYFTPYSTEHPTTVVRITRDAAVDTKPVAAASGDTVWVAWESNRGEDAVRRVHVASISGDKVSEPVAISAPGISAYDPDIVAMDDGSIAVAWHAFADNNYDVYLARRGPDGAWSAPRRLTSSPQIDRHPALFARGTDLCVAYERADMNGYGIGATRDKTIVVARVAADGLEALAPEGLPIPGEAASPCFDETGRIWLAYMVGAGRAWNLMLTSCNGATWTEPTLVSNLSSFDRRPSLVIEESDAVFCFQADNIGGRSFSSVEESLGATSDIYAAVHGLDAYPAATAANWQPYAESAAPFEAGQLRVAYGEDAGTPSIEYKGQTLYLYYGDLHDHTEVSQCNRIGDESIEEAYADMRDIAGLDFACVTDHGYNLTPYLWNFTAKLARINNDSGRFLTFLAEEWTSTFEEYSDEHPYGFYGHRNIILEDAYFPRWWNARDRQTPTQVWEDLRKMDANFVVIPHQLADTGNVPTDWNYTDEVAQPVAEIFQGRGSYEYKGAPREAQRTMPTKGAFIQDAWARGIVIGVIASPDHTGGKGKACVWATGLDRAAILDALRARHSFGTSAARMIIDFRVNGAFMGEKIPAPDGKPVEVTVDVQCPADIDRIEICRNNTFIYSTSPAGRTAKFTFVDENPVDGKSYYYARVMQKDEELGWTSPVWLGFP